MGTDTQQELYSAPITEDSYDKDPLVPIYEICPECGARARSRCRCRIGSRGCACGCHWFMRNGKTYAGDGHGPDAPVLIVRKFPVSEETATAGFTQSPETEAKILATVKAAPSFNPEVPNKLYRVGGIVRDSILGMSSKDIDYLVTNVAFDDLKAALAKISDSIVSTNVGESMQVIKAVIDGSDEPYDFAIPRTEVYGTSGKHTDVKTFGDPSLPIESDLARRDLTFNAMAQDVETGEIVDPFKGAEDLKNKKVRAVRNPAERFKEDPLRMIRVIQFATRFGFEPEPAVLQALRDYNYLIESITGERILEEFHKAFKKAAAPSNRVFVDLLVSTGIGAILFGEDFAPVVSDDIQGDKVLVNLILLFLHGGNFDRLKPSSVEATAIRLARKLLTDDALSVMLRNGAYLQPITDAVRSIGDADLISKVDSLQGVPLAPKDLAIDSDWLMARGIKGAELGALQRKMIQGIYERKLANDTAALQEFAVGHSQNTATASVVTILEAHNVPHLALRTTASEDYQDDTEYSEEHRDITRLGLIFGAPSAKGDGIKVSYKGHYLEIHPSKLPVETKPGKPAVRGRKRVAPEYKHVASYFITNGHVSNNIAKEEAEAWLRGLKAKWDAPVTSLHE